MHSEVFQATEACIVFHVVYTWKHHEVQIGHAKINLPQKSISDNVLITVTSLQTVARDLTMIS
ncbi:uncharacterized protein PHALS_15140 [Plasmopara halstedii]|uniref:Uncharacterized protein n=1 Tax=Plasmopara halstedii TaxID=4781 RepID=A0A0P1ABB9_PLAHL|nr:uncharacterized protein PHALS_15140 [Plasmopara halstedii]CEG38044.1 hypothetical protein PHALS_15140 [Plasmopara halstedii]|eukprot:XP_024574413.1 hypothetical protein PHALS_15140 [Plasmopara halstedii]